MINKTVIVDSDSFDPYMNLAVERRLFLTCPEDTVIMYLWQNENTIVIGRNQNPYSECHVNNIEALGAHLARRHTGGGAVFHDRGNLNFSFIYSDDNSKLISPAELIRDCCRTFGIETEISGRNDITSMSRKFSGNAFCRKGKMFLHHGTVMIDLEMSRLGDYLNVSREKLAGKGVSSVSKRVINLKEICPELTVSDFRRALFDIFEKKYPEITLRKEYESICQEPETMAIRDSYASKEWLFGSVSDFNINKKHRFPWGSCEIRLLVKDHRIESAEIFSDAMDPDLIADVSLSLKGRTFEYRSVSEALDTLKNSPQENNRFHVFSVNREEILNDILELLK